MEITTVRGEARGPGGKHRNERLRRRGLIPAVIYGHNEPPATAAVSRHDLALALEHMKHVVQMELDGKLSQYLIKDVQYDHLQKDPIHVDLMRVSLHERVHVKVALELKGEPKGIHEGGELVHLITDLEVECPLSQIPEVLYHNIKDLALGHALHVKELDLPAHIKPRHNPDDIVALVRLKRGVGVEEEAAAAPAEAATAEPEVIGKGPKEKEEEGGE